MKRSIYTIYLFALMSCQKTDFVEYKITSIQGAQFGCLYTASAEGKPDIEIKTKCDTYKLGQIVFKVEE